MVQQAGGTLIGYSFETLFDVDWTSMTGKRPTHIHLPSDVANQWVVNVNIAAPHGAGFDWGFLGTKPKNIRIFKGPPESCSIHPWDASKRLSDLLSTPFQSATEADIAHGGIKVPVTAPTTST